MTTDDDARMGAWFGAAIGDAMGGPVEGAHFRHMRKTVGEVTGLLPYEEHYTPLGRRREYMKSEAAGAVTDDTFIRAAFTRFYLATKAPRTPRMLVDWMEANEDFSFWWPPAADILHRAARGEVAPDKAGLQHRQGGGNGWWTPIGILNAGNPAGAESEVRNLSRVWKRGVEQDLLSGTQTALATALVPGTDWRDVLDGLLRPCGPLARALIGRGVRIGLAARNFEELADGLYAEVLMPITDDVGKVAEPTDDPLGQLPDIIAPVADTDQTYLSVFFAEQIPIAAAAYAFGKGDPRICVPTAVMIGRDCDSTATTVGSWCGAMVGETGLPHEWVETVERANADWLDLRGLGKALIELAH